MEVMLYYIRQKQQYLPDHFDMRATCGTCHLNSFFCAQFDEFKWLAAVGERWKDIRVLQFLQGGLRHGINCQHVDRIYLPINQPNEHWFLAEVRLNEWAIHIMDSLYTARRKQSRIECVRPLAEMLPHALEEVQFFEGRPELRKRRGSPLSIVYGKGYPQQDG